MSITQSQTDAVIAAARQAAEQIGVPMNVAVFDNGANLKAFVRMDGALLGSADAAIGKAKTAALFGVNSEAIGEITKAGGPAPGLERTNGGLVVFAGGIPVKNAAGAVIGAVGVSGGHADQDTEVAQAAVAAAGNGKEA